MSGFLKEQMLKMAVSAIGADNISAAIETFMSQAVLWAREQPLNEEEVKVVGVLYENESELFYAAVTLTAEGQIKRYLVDEPLKILVTKILDNIS